MGTRGSVTQLVYELTDGDGDAARELWNRYFEQLKRLARYRLRTVPTALLDEDDVVVDAFASFCRRQMGSDAHALHDRGEFWRLLIVITKRKAINALLRLNAQKNRMLHVDNNVFDFLGDELTPSQATELFDEIRAFCEDVRETSDALYAVLLMRLEGLTNKEIAERMSCDVRSVQRKINLIKRIWDKRVSRLHDS